MYKEQACQKITRERINKITNNIGCTWWNEDIQKVETITRIK